MCPNSEPITNCVQFFCGWFACVHGYGFDWEELQCGREFRICRGMREEWGWAPGWLWVGVSSEVTAGDPMHAASLPLCLLYTLMPFTDQIKARMTNAQRLETSVLEHTVHPSPC